MFKPLYPPLLPPESVERRPPVNLVADDGVLFSHEYRRDFDAVSLRLYSDRDLLSNGFLARHGLPEFSAFAVERRGLGRLKTLVRSVQYSAFTRPLRVEQALVLTDENANGFFHWFCDELPKLEALLLSAPEELERRTLLIPAMADYAYLRTSLEPYGIPEFRVLLPRERARCADLLWVPPVAPTGNYRSALMRSLRDRFRRYFVDGSSTSPSGASLAVASGAAGAARNRRRLFISRAEAPWRKIANEADLAPTLARYGFERVVMERLSLPEQVRLVSQAQIIVGNHGAGLTHILWMNPGTRVLELRRRGDRQNNCYYSLAQAMDVDYYYQLCDAVDETEDTHTVDFIVDIKALERNLALLEKP